MTMLRPQIQAPDWSEIRTSGLLLSGAFPRSHVGPVSKAKVNALDYHNPVSEWIGTPRAVNANHGAAFGEPVQKGILGALRRTFGKMDKTTADTRYTPESQKPTRDGTPPNSGRPEYGIQEEQQHGGL